MLAITLAGMVWGGGIIYRQAWTAAIHGGTNMNTLVALGTGAAFAYSLVATVAPGVFLHYGLHPDVYYDAVLLIIGFLLLGRWLDARAKRRTLDALHEFMRLQPQSARLLRDGREMEVPLAQVVAGDIVRLRPGERVPVDGVVLSGVTSIDESLITGESLPVTRQSGDRVIGGSLNFDGAIEYRATSVGADSVLGQMMRLVEEAQSSRAPMQQLADRVSAVFVPVVLGLALLTFLIWIFAGGGAGRAFAVSVAVLVIACPCAMGLAVPAALTVAIGRGAQLGVLFKGGESLERLARIDMLVLDKTGTLTEGKPEVAAVHGCRWMDRRSGAGTGRRTGAAVGASAGAGDPERRRETGPPGAGRDRCARGSRQRHSGKHRRQQRGGGQRRADAELGVPVPEERLRRGNNADVRRAGGIAWRA